MYRTLAVVVMAYAICYPRIASQASTELAAYGSGPTRAQHFVEDLSSWMQEPLVQILAAIQNRTPRI
jgi:hypothetical protein